MSSIIYKTLPWDYIICVCREWLNVVMWYQGGFVPIVHILKFSLRSPRKYWHTAGSRVYAWEKLKWDRTRFPTGREYDQCSGKHNKCNVVWEDQISTFWKQEQYCITIHGFSSVHVTSLVRNILPVALLVLRFYCFLIAGNYGFGFWYSISYVWHFILVGLTYLKSR